MKKWLIVFFSAVALSLASVYLFIPGTIRLNAGTALKVTGQGIHRMLLDKNNLAKWWPGRISHDSLYFGDYAYTINTGNITVMPVFINGQNTSLSTSLFLISIDTDSTQLGWVGSMAASGNPVVRFRDYLKARKLNSDMRAILQKMGNFYSRPENIYGTNIKKVLIVDSFLISTSEKCMGYPSNDFVYGLVNKLRKYATINSAKESGNPMLNISTEDSINFDVKVAIPTDKLLPSSRDIFQKRMPPRCIILMTAVKGGNAIAATAFHQMQKYVDDHQLKAAAIPFYALETDRTKEPDPDKWITKIYFPVMIYGTETN